MKGSGIIETALYELYLERLKGLACTREYAMPVSNRFDVLGILEDPLELWPKFKLETLQDIKECIRECPRSRSGFASMEMLRNIWLCYVGLEVS